MLRPGTPKEGKPRELRAGEVEGELAEPLKTYAKEAGLIMRRPPIVAYSMYALEATEYAKDQGLFDPFHRGMYKAYWERGDNIGDLEVVKSVALDAGLDWDDLAPKLESRHYEESVTQQFQEAMDLGVQGIPGFLIGNFLFTGARPYEIFQSVMKKVLTEEV